MQKKGKERLFLAVGSEAGKLLVAGSCLDFNQAWKMSDVKRTLQGITSLLQTSF